MSLASLCRHTITVRRRTSAAGTLGGVSATFADLVANVPASIQQARGRVVETFAQRGVKVSHVIYTPSDTGATGGDLVVDEEGAAYLVVNASDMGDRGTAFALYVDRTV